MEAWDERVFEIAERFGGSLPRPETSATIEAVWARAPTAVSKLIEQVAADFEQGVIRSPWAILKSRVEQVAVDQPKQAAANEREKAISRAEQWIRTAGLHYDRPSEIEQELFGSEPADIDRHGEPIVSGGNHILGAFSNDADLRRRMVNLWRDLRPAGEQSEREQAQRLARWKLQHDTIEADARLARKLAEAESYVAVDDNQRP